MSPRFYMETLTPTTSERDCRWLEMGSSRGLEQALIQADYSPYEETRTQTHT